MLCNRQAFAQALTSKIHLPYRRKRTIHYPSCSRSSRAICITNLHSAATWSKRYRAIYDFATDVLKDVDNDISCDDDKTKQNTLRKQKFRSLTGSKA